MSLRNNVQPEGNAEMRLDEEMNCTVARQALDDRGPDSGLRAHSERYDAGADLRVTMAVRAAFVVEAPAELSASLWRLPHHGRRWRDSMWR